MQTNRHETPTDELAIIEHYGVNNQLKKLGEEYYELVEASLKHLYGVGYSDLKAKEAVTSELADTWVLWEQLRQHFGIDIAEVRKEYDYKISRQLARIMNEKKEL